jgi:hypothetical protein
MGVYNPQGWDNWERSFQLSELVRVSLPQASCGIGVLWYWYDDRGGHTAEEEMVTYTVRTRTTLIVI